MIETELALIRIETELSEWKEELGDQFPSFLNHVLISRLLKSQDEIEFLRRCLNSNNVFR